MFRPMFSIASQIAELTLFFLGAIVLANAVLRFQ
jgi:hypothetical protein